MNQIAQRLRSHYIKNYTCNYTEAYFTQYKHKILSQQGKHLKKPKFSDYVFYDC